MVSVLVYVMSYKCYSSFFFSTLLKPIISNSIFKCYSIYIVISKNSCKNVKFSTTLEYVVNGATDQSGQYFIIHCIYKMLILFRSIFLFDPSKRFYKEYMNFRTDLYPTVFQSSYNKCFSRNFFFF